MAISVVDLFRPQPQDGVAQILAGGTNVLVGAINNAVQIGRDTANLRATQEREYLAERERNENLNQRRAEFFTRTQQIDRQFGENVFQDRRNFTEDVTRDRRDFDFKEATDTRDYALREYSTLKNILNQDEDNSLQREKFDLEKKEHEENKSLLRTRANDIITTTTPPNIIKRIFTGAEGPLPEDDLELGRELKDIGVKLKDPTLIGRGDALESRGRKGVLTRREEIRNTPLPARPSTRKPNQTDEDRLVELERGIKAFELETSDPNSDFEPTSRDILRVREAKLELEELKKKLAGKSGSKPVEPSEDPLSKFYPAPKPK